MSQRVIYGSLGDANGLQLTERIARNMMDKFRNTPRGYAPERVNQRIHGEKIHGEKMKLNNRVAQRRVLI